MDEELRTAVSKLYSEYWHSDISGQQFQQKIIDLFQAREQHPSTSRGYLMGFKAGQQQLLSELLGELPDKELPEVKPGTLIIEHEGKLVKTENLAKMRNTGFNQAIDQVVSVIERLQNKTNDGGSNGGL